MFASILDRYPARAGDAPTDAASARSRLETTLQAQFEAGMGMLGDGIVWDVSTSASAIDAAVGAWNDAVELARSLAGAETPGLEPPIVKVCLLGPWSSASRTDLRTGASRKHLLTVARRIHDALEALFEAGAPVVQLVEDGLVGLDPADTEALKGARDALRLATRDAAGHLALSVGGGSVDRLGAPFMFELPFASYAFDLINGPDNWRLIAQAPGDRGILCGVADCRSEAADEQAVMIWAARYAASTGGRGLERVALCPSSGLERLSDEVARAKLEGLAAASRTAGLPPDELAGAIDPRAVDARSAALGRYQPRRRRAPGTVAP